MTATTKPVDVSRWIPFSERFPPSSQALDDPNVSTTDTVLVTNGLNCRDRMGRMSHVWLLSPIKSSSGEIVGFTDSGSKVHGLTHWKDAGLAAIQGENVGGDTDGC